MTTLRHPLSTLAPLFLSLTAANLASAQSGDWTGYNCDVEGSRFNRAETTLGVANAAQIEVKWRFPADDAELRIGAIHATPSVVGGEVYFGTATDPAFYKVGADGRLLWSYRNPEAVQPEKKPSKASAKPNPNARYESTDQGIFSSAWVSDDSVFFTDNGGWIYALDRKSGAERWKLNTRAESFPSAHALNLLFASPIMADGKLICAGGAIEQAVAGSIFYKGSTGRGFVVALEPASGELLWIHNVGEQPMPLDPPIVIADKWGNHTFFVGPATSSIWCTPSFDAKSGTLFFGTDVNTAPRRPTDDNPRLDTPDSCAIVALDVRDGTKRWSTQISPGDVWVNAMRSYDPKEGRYTDQSIGDTPKLYTLELEGEPTRVVGAGSKNGGFYVLRADDGRIVAHTPIYLGAPTYPLDPVPDARMLALPSCIGGLQSGCATDGTTVFTNGIDALCLGSQEAMWKSGVPPTGGRVVALSADTQRELWRHERPRIAAIGGSAAKPMYKDVGDPVASGLALANGVLYFTTTASGKLVVLDAAQGTLLKEIELGPVWSGPSVSNGCVYVGTGNTLFNDASYESFFPKQRTGVLYCFGLPNGD
jgi:outer membrane protein assembly factor BamB